MNSVEHSIFKNGSTTYYWSSKFFPRNVRDDVFKLYSFVRVADDYVDCTPQCAEQFYALRSAWDVAKDDDLFDATPAAADTIDERVIKNIVYVARKYNFDQAWIESFFDSMAADLTGKKYRTLDDTLWYIYGSAEVIGLMMAKIMELPQQAMQAAKMQGRAMQFINFLRDIAEDNQLGRCYFPADDLAQFGLPDLREETVRANYSSFSNLVQHELARYAEWQQAATEGYRYIPHRLLVPLKTAADMYNWTATQIAKDPLKIYTQKIKPSKYRVTRSFAAHQADQVFL